MAGRKKSKRKAPALRKGRGHRKAKARKSRPVHASIAAVKARHVAERQQMSADHKKARADLRVQHSDARKRLREKQSKELRDQRATLKLLSSSKRR